MWPLAAQAVVGITDRNTHCDTWSSPNTPRGKALYSPVMLFWR